MVEFLLLSPVRCPLPVTSMGSPEIYGLLASLPAGDVVVLGASGPGIPPQKVFFDQRVHGRKLLLDPDRPGPPRKIPSGSIFVVLDGVGGRLREDQLRRLGPPDVETLDGVAWVLK